MTNFLLIWLLILFPMLALSASVEKNCNYKYYPKLDPSAADELHVIKQNYYRYGNELKILADARIKEIKETSLDVNEANDESI